MRKRKDPLLFTFFCSNFVVQLKGNPENYSLEINYIKLIIANYGKKEKLFDLRR